MPKITIAGIEFDVSDEQAAQAQTVADTVAQLAAKTETATKSIEDLRAESARQTAAAADAKRQAELAEATKAGDLAKVQELSQAKLNALAERYRDAELRTALASHPKLRRAGLDDKARQALIDDQLVSLRQSAKYDLDAGALTDADGKPLDITAAIDGHVTARPWLAEPAGAQGSGAAPGGGGAQPAPGQITLADLQKATPQQVQDIANGKLVVVE